MFGQVVNAEFGIDSCFCFVFILLEANSLLQKRNISRYITKNCIKRKDFDFTGIFGKLIS